MKIRFLHCELKVLVTRISGVFNIETKDGWDNKVTKGSFKISDERLYDKILQKITELKDLYKYQYSLRYDQIRHAGHLGQTVIKRAYIIFEIKNGRVIDVEVDNPKTTKATYNVSTERIIFENTKKILSDEANKIKMEIEKIREEIDNDH